MCIEGFGLWVLIQDSLDSSPEMQGMIFPEVEETKTKPSSPPADTIITPYNQSQFLFDHEDDLREQKS